jgi:drug/metabolite transporter (DMT)-like permease
MPQDIQRGILCIVLSTVFLTSQDGMTKWLLQYHHAGEVMFYRGLLALPLALLLHRMLGHRVKRLRSKRPRLTAYRSVIAVVGSMFVTLSFLYMPLADALAVIFTSPLIITALSGTMLGEEVGWRRWAAVAVGFCGVVLITDPGHGSLSWTIALPLLAALTSAFRDIASRQLGGADPATTTLFWNMVANMVGGALTLPFFGLTLPTEHSLFLLVISSVLVVLAMWLIILAFQLASGSIVAPYRYLSLVWAGLIGYAVWGDIPSETKLLGAAVVAASGLYIWRREVRGRLKLRGA